MNECRFYLDEPDEQCIAFLRFGFTLDHGRYSWRRHYVTCAADGTVLSVMGAHHHGQTRFYDLHSIWMVQRFFGPRKTMPIVSRGAILQREMVMPKSGETVFSGFATDERMRGTGVLTAMLADALATGWLPWFPNHQYLLDVRLNNSGARRLYERLGFVAQPRTRPPHPRLPVELTSMRMAWSAQGMTALRAQGCARRSGSE
jgi:GNAT superfamily N-acetyltransferase